MKNYYWWPLWFLFSQQQMQWLMLLHLPLHHGMLQQQKIQLACWLLLLNS